MSFVKSKQINNASIEWKIRRFALQLIGSDGFLNLTARSVVQVMPVLSSGTGSVPNERVNVSRK